LWNFLPSLVAEASSLNQLDKFWSNY